ncbi:hypothetical protein EV122DRAFT_279731 [Schizophyllum commune]
MDVAIVIRGRLRWGDLRPRILSRMDSLDRTSFVRTIPDKSNQRQRKRQHCAVRAPVDRTPEELRQPLPKRAKTATLEPILAAVKARTAVGPRPTVARLLAMIGDAGPLIISKTALVEQYRAVRHATSTAGTIRQAALNAGTNIARITKEMLDTVERCTAEHQDCVYMLPADSLLALRAFLYDIRNATDVIGRVESVHARKPNTMELRAGLLNANDVIIITVKNLLGAIDAHEMGVPDDTDSLMMAPTSTHPTTPAYPSLWSSSTAALPSLNDSDASFDRNLDSSTSLVNSSLVSTTSDPLFSFSDANMSRGNTSLTSTLPFDPATLISFDSEPSLTLSLDSSRDSFGSLDSFSAITTTPFFSSDDYALTHMLCTEISGGQSARGFEDADVFKA